jgi:hypothetical protein
MATRSRRFWREYRLLIGCSAVLWIVVLAGAWVGYRHVRPLLTEGLLERPAELADVGIVHGAGALRKGRLFQDSAIGSITEISIWRESAGRDVGVMVVGTRGAVLTDALGRIAERVAFEEPGSGRCLDRMEAIPGRDGRPGGFLNRGSWACPAARLDRQGRALWWYGRSPGVDDTAVGDLDGDGRLDFVVGFNGGGGVHRVDDGGRTVWNQPDANVWRVNLLDTDGDGRPEILHSNAAGLLTIRDETGQVVRRVKTPTYLSHFSLVPWPRREQPALLQLDDGKIWVLDAGGAAVATLPAPRAKAALDARGTAVRVRVDEPELLAVVGTYGPWHRSVLYLYAPSRALLYEEVLSDVCGGIAPLPTLAGTAEAIVVGCDGVVWRYDFTQAAPEADLPARRVGRSPTASSARRILRPGSRSGAPPLL